MQTDMPLQWEQNTQWDRLTISKKTHLVVALVLHVQAEVELAVDNLAAKAESVVLPLHRAHLAAHRLLAACVPHVTHRVAVPVRRRRPAYIIQEGHGSAPYESCGGFNLPPPQLPHGG